MVSVSPQASARLLHLAIFLFSSGVARNDETRSFILMGLSPEAFILVGVSPEAFILLGVSPEAQIFPGAKKLGLNPPFSLFHERDREGN